MAIDPTEYVQVRTAFLEHLYEAYGSLATAYGASLEATAVVADLIARGELIEAARQADALHAGCEAARASVQESLARVQIWQERLAGKKAMHQALIAHGVTADFREDVRH